ncbi:MAG: hypothetical protein ACTSQF_00475 [Candidatus Heimdallarchaeaceae archaeon]
MFKVQKEIVDWLQGDDNTPVKYLTQAVLLEKNQQGTEVSIIRKKINSYKPIIEILENQMENTFWFDKGKTKNYKKYLGSFWQIIFLSELNAQKTEQIENGIEHIFTTGQASNGGFSMSGTNSGSITCLTANIVRALIHFGYWEDIRTKKAVDYILSRINDKEAFICYPSASLMKHCYMAIPKIIHALGLIPIKDQTNKIKDGIELCTNILLENQIFKYIPVENKQWLKYLNESKFKGKLIFEEREKFLKQHPTNEKTAKPGWLKFGFPLNYNSDVLDAMRSLVVIKQKSTPETEEALEIIKGKSVDGRWFNEKQYKSPMYTQIEQYTQPSKWLTFHALAVLKYFEGLEII